MPTAAEQFQADLERTVGKLSSMPLARLDRADDEGRSPADRAHALAQYLVDKTTLLTPDDPTSQALPRLSSHASAAALAVVGRDFLLAALGSNPPADWQLLTATELLRAFRITYL